MVMVLAALVIRTHYFYSAIICGDDRSRLPLHRELPAKRQQYQVLLVSSAKLPESAAISLGSHRHVQRFRLPNAAAVSEVPPHAVYAVCVLCCDLWAGHVFEVMWFRLFRF
jgi:hypothetical protein